MRTFTEWNSLIHICHFYGVWAIVRFEMCWKFTPELSAGCKHGDTSISFMSIQCILCATNELSHSFNSIDLHTRVFCNAFECDVIDYCRFGSSFGIDSKQNNSIRTARLQIVDVECNRRSLKWWKNKENVFVFQYRFSQVFSIDAPPIHKYRFGTQQNLQSQYILNKITNSAYKWNWTNSPQP